MDGGNGGKVGAAARTRIAQAKAYATKAKRLAGRGAVEIQRLRRMRPGANYFLLYQSAFMARNCCHFSGRSSRAKIAVTGQTGTQAPQSMHSTGLMYSMVSD